jgi:hypothetical protein
MYEEDPVEYKVLLVFPGFGQERENAQEILEEALNYLNTQKDEPGMRFAQNVSARLEIVADVEQAREILENDDDLAMMILHDLPEDERDELTKDCAAKTVPVCHTLDVEPPPPLPRSKSGRREMKVVFRKADKKKPRAHTICQATLTGSLDCDEEELMDRAGQLITVMALGVMEHHWTLYYGPGNRR